jgi:hypothetical protein
MAAAMRKCKAVRFARIEITRNQRAEYGGLSCDNFPADWTPATEEVGQRLTLVKKL